MHRIICGAMFLAISFVMGCGGGGGASGTLIPVVGTIKIDDQPTGNVMVTYQPDGTTKGNGGNAMTDSTGRYEIMSPQGNKGLLPGDYKVIVSLRLNPDGSPPDPNTPPIESKAREMMGPKHSDITQTDLKVKISADDKRSFDFSLPSLKKKK